MKQRCIQFTYHGFQYGRSSSPLMLTTVAPALTSSCSASSDPRLSIPRTASLTTYTLLRFSASLIASSAASVVAFTQKSVARPTMKSSSMLEASNRASHQLALVDALFRDRTIKDFGDSGRRFEVRRQRNGESGISVHVNVCSLWSVQDEQHNSTSDRSSPCVRPCRRLARGATGPAPRARYRACPERSDPATSLAIAFVCWHRADTRLLSS